MNRGPVCRLSIFSVNYLYSVFIEEYYLDRVYTRIMTAWTDAVSAEFKMGRKTNPKFSLKMAMMKAKKSYRKMSRSSGKTSKIRGGAMPPLNPASVTGVSSLHLGTAGNKGPTLLGGKKSKKSRKSRKGSKKSEMGDM